VHVGVDGTGGRDAVLPREQLGARPDDEARVDAALQVGVARLADADDAAVLDADVPFTTPRTGSRTIALVMTRSSTPLALVACGSAAIPSRAVLPPP